MLNKIMVNKSLSQIVYFIQFNDFFKTKSKCKNKEETSTLKR